MKITERELLNEVLRFRYDGRLIVRPDDSPSGVELPSQWRSVLTNPFGSFRVTGWKEWDQVIKKAPNIGQFLQSNLHFNSIFFDQERSLLNLLYVYSSEGREINVYSGLPPAAEIPERLSMAFKHFPPELRDFYIGLHNGWTFDPCDSMGPLPLEDCAFLSDDGFDFGDDKAREAPFDPNKVLTIFHNGAGDYLCLNFGELNQDGTASGMLWWHEEPTEPDFVDFWPALNAWIGIFFEGADVARRP